MFSRSGKLLLILLIPALVYGVLKGILYYNAKKTVDEIVTAAANHAEIRYDGISTELRGAVTVNGISVEPIGAGDAIAIDALRIASDDPMFFIRGAQWQPGEGAPPESMAFNITGVRMPLGADFVELYGGLGGVRADVENPCIDGLTIDPQLLSQMGFSELSMDLDGNYRLNAAERTLEFGMNMDMHDIESTHISATMADVDAEAIAQGGMPQLSLGGVSIAVQISPEFGRRALKACAAGTGKSVQEWSGLLAEQALAGFEQQGISLGHGLSNAVRDFYRDWGEFEVIAAPSKPVGLLSMMFLPPNQLVDALSLRFILNEQLITDSRFTVHRPDAQGLGAFFGSEPEETTEKVSAKRRRIIVRRQFEPVPLRNIGSFVDHKVQIKPRGQPLREGLLKRVRDGEAEVEQTVHGGKYTVYVALSEIESVQALIQRELNPKK